MKKYLIVPDYDIKGFITYKKRGMNFRPAATGINGEETLLRLKNESFEEEDMINFKETKILDDKSFFKMSPSLFLPYENTIDTQWYQLGKDQVNYALFYKLNDLSPVLIPEEISMFKDYVEINDKQRLHWSNSEGFSHDTDLNLAIQKGISELIENHQKMFWWFGKYPIIECQIPDKILSILKKENNIHNVKVYMLCGKNILGKYTYMTLLRTQNWPYISVGFGTDFNKNRGITHSILEAVNSYRGIKWYQMVKGEKIYNSSFVVDFENKINETLGNKKSKLESESELKKIDIYYKVLNNKKGYTIKVFSPQLQPLISNKYVPFYFKELCTEKNKRLRKRYNGVPFI